MTIFDGVRVRKWSWRAEKWNGIFGRGFWVKVELSGKLQWCRES